jgi:soluble lytic murein transglycosylase-like protein
VSAAARTFVRALPSARPRPRRPAFACALAVALAAAGCSSSSSSPSSSAPTATARAAPRLEATAAGVRWEGAALSGMPRGRAAPVARWWRAARDTDLVAAAVRVPLADTLVARRDTARADSLLGAPSLARSPWAWDALRRRAAWAMARGDALRAAKLLDAAERSAWPAQDEAGWRALRARVHVALRDTLAGEALARSVLEELAIATPGSGAALALLDSLARKRGERFAIRLERKAALVEWASGRRERALARNARVLRNAAPEERGDDAVLRVRWLIDARRPAAAVAASDTAVRWTRGTPDFDQARLERARAFRAAGRSDSALALYQRLGRTAESGGIRATAWWECGREAQDESRWELGARAFRHADSLGRANPATSGIARQAASLAGLMEWMAGDESAAIARWRASGDRRGRFWLGVALRRRGDSAGDSILRAEFASRPGVDFYAVAARETLRVSAPTAPPARAVRDSVEPQLVEAIAELSGPLALPEVAMRVVGLRDRVDPRLGRVPQRQIAASTWQAIAAAAYASGDVAGGTRAAERASLLLEGGPQEAAWLPWAFPPAFERELFAAADGVGIERALFQGLVRQESRFDPRAVSRSNALGLTQLLPGTARDMARELKEPLRSDSLIFEPSRALRYGARYYKKLHTRFGASPVALAAYNAGPGKVRKDWRDIVARGGWAMYVEMGSNADTQEYMRRILAFRAAYRVLKPYVAPRE